MWILAAISCSVAGMVLLLRGYRSYRPTSTPMCRSCGYDLTGLASNICPECGTGITAETIVYREGYRRPRLLVLGVTLLVLGALLVVRGTLLRQASNRTLSPRPISRMILDTKNGVMDLRSAFASGKWAAENQRPPPPGWGYKAFIGPPHLSLRLIRLALLKRSLDAETRRMATSEIDSAISLFEGRFERSPAIDSTNPEDAGQVTPVLDAVNGHLDKILQILKGR